MHTLMQAMNDILEDSGTMANVSIFDDFFHNVELKDKPFKVEFQGIPRMSR